MKIQFKLTDGEKVYEGEVLLKEAKSGRVAHPCAARVGLFGLQDWRVAHP
jgi:hypothetical protein